MTVNLNPGLPGDWHRSSGGAFDGPVKVWDSVPANSAVITVPTAAAFTFSAGSGDDLPCSFFARIKMRDATQFRIISKFESAVGDREWAFFTTGGDLLFFALYDSLNQQTAAASVTDFSTFEDQSISVCATYDGSNTFAGITLYKDGLAISVTDESSGSYNGMDGTSIIVRLGRLDGFDSADGQLQDVRVIAAELTPTQVLTLHTTNSNPMGDVASWPLDGDADDISGNDHDGTNVNGTFVFP